MALFFAASAMTLQSGCILPLGVVPVPSIGSGEVVGFRDVKGDLIHADGLLIVHRRRYHRFFMAGFHESPSNQVASVTDGEAQIPFDLVPLTIGLAPNEFAIGMTVDAILSDPLTYIPYFLPTFPFLLIPIPVANPKESIYYIPLIPGYYMAAGLDSRWDQVWPERSSSWRYWPHVGDRSITMCASSSAPDTLRRYWQEVRDRLRLRFRRPKFDEGPDLRLEYYHYRKVRAFVDRELKRIEALPTGGDNPTSGPATRPNP